ncbi:MAG: transporter permease [Aeromicrobium sp.]|nr:transporter permease [Aeromicrobium sp.]
MTAPAPVTIDTTRPGVPMSRLVKVELRKMFNTRSGFWLMMSIAILATIATVVVILVLALADDPGVTYASFAAAIGTPMAVLLPVIAILAVTSEWSQRTGLITFTLVPHRGQLIAAKAIAAVIVAVGSMILAMAIGAVGNVVGTLIVGSDMVWDFGVKDFLLILLANTLGLLIGFMLGVLIRNSAAAIVAYFVYSLVLPGLFGLLASISDWFSDVQPWVDFNDAQTPLFDGGPSGEQWAQLGTSGIIWFVIPLAVGIWAVLRSEVK